jgi:hypothetical protein
LSCYATKQRKLISTYRETCSHLDQTSSELSENPADLALLQEVDWDDPRPGDKDVAADLAKHLQMKMACAIETLAYIGQATLCRYPIRRSRMPRCKRQSGFWQPHA